MTAHTPEPCGCRVTLTEAGTYLGAITYCPTHAAAPDLLAALKEGCERDPLMQCPKCQRHRAALAQAKEERMRAHLLADGTAFLEAVERHFNIDNDAVTFGPEARAFRAAIAQARGG